MSEDNNIKFKSTKRKNLRARRNSSDEEDADDQNAEEIL